MANDNGAPSGLADYAGTWTLDPAQTTIEFRTKAMWVLGVKGTFRASGGKGTVDANGAVSGDLIVDAATVTTGNNKRDQHLKTEDFFEVSAYPTLSFEATGAQPAGDGRWTVQGNLTIHGQTRPLELQASVAGADTGHVDVTAEAEIDRSQWGLTWAKMGAGLHNKVIVKARHARD